MESLLARLDFDATLDTDPSVTLLASLPASDKAVLGLKEASAQGNLLAVEENLKELRSRTIGDLWMKNVVSSLKLAARNHHTALLDYLLREGVPISPDLVKDATLSKDTVSLELFLRHGWDINNQLEWAVPPALAFAVEDEALTKWFLSHGASPNAQCLLDITPLSVAVQYAPFSVIQALFAGGGSVDYGQLLHYAVWRTLDDYLEVLRYIIGKGAPINDIMYQSQPDCYQQRKAFGLGTPLHDAAAVGKLDTVRALVDHGAHPLIKDSRGRTTLQRAQSNGDIAVVEYLQHVADHMPPPSRQFTDEMRLNSS